jgi:6-pyruvoyltetrahydropterin/6-carboxytetrahydropterin synthase
LKRESILIIIENFLGGVVFYLRKKIIIAASHRLELDYNSPCSRIHGHNWFITVYCRAEKLNKNGMVVDFKEISKIVNQFDHAMVNDIIEQPTAENMAEYFCDNIPFCYKVEVEETPGNEAVYVSE